jgi:hypothetical protein
MFKKLTHPLTLFRNRSISEVPLPSTPEYISKIHHFKSLRRKSSGTSSTSGTNYGTSTCVYKLMKASIILYYKNKTCICIIDGNYPINTISEHVFNGLSDCEKSTTSCYIDFQLEHVEFKERFYIGNMTILGKPFIQKHVQSMDFGRRIIILNDLTRLNIFGEIPPNTISICIENMHFLALLDLKRKSSIISLDILEKMHKHDTTQTKLNFSCQLLPDVGDYEFNQDFCVIDNNHKYVVLGIDFMKHHVARIGKNYIQLKNGLRVHYLKK